MATKRNGSVAKYMLLHNGEKLKKGYHNGNTEIWSAGSTVTYYVDSATAYTEDVDNGASCLAPTTFTPTKSGWTFVGWREDTTASSTVLTSKIMDSDPIVLYAVFRQTITVTYYNNSTTASTTSGYRYYNNGNTVNPSFTLTQATKSGWTARGWSTGTAGNSGITVNNATAFSRSSNITLYGMYQKTCTLTCISYNSTQYAYGTAYYNSNGQTVAATTTAPSGAAMSGWTWRGWSNGLSGNTSATAGVSFANGATVSMDTSNYTIYGLYQKTITANFYSGLSSSNHQTAQGTAYYNSSGNTAAASITIPSGAAVSGWTWRGWAQWWTDVADAAVTYNNGATVSVAHGNDGITFYGLYQKTIYLYYNGNGATSGSVATQSGTRYHNSAGNYSNPSFTVSGNGFSRTGYAFAGYWMLDSGSSYWVGNTITISYDQTLYAQWVANAFYVVNAGALVSGNYTSASRLTGGHTGSEKDYGYYCHSNGTAFECGATITFNTNGLTLLDVTGDEAGAGTGRLRYVISSGSTVIASATNVGTSLNLTNINISGYSSITVKVYESAKSSTNAWLGARITGIWVH